MYPNKNFLDRGLLVARTLLNQAFLVRKLKGKSYYRHHEFVNRYGTSIFTDDKGYIVVATNPSSFLLIDDFSQKKYISPHFYHE